MTHLEELKLKYAYLTASEKAQRESINSMRRLLARTIRERKSVELAISQFKDK